MIETAMLVALGFTIASLLALLIAPAVWRRAVRLTRREIEATMPISLADIKADKDLLRAESAVEMRRLELALEKAKQRAARHLMERNRHMVEMGKLESEIATLKNTVAERSKASSALEQTVRQRIPALEDQLEEARHIISVREQEIADRARAFENQTESLELAQAMIRRQEEEINRLREALEGGAVAGGLAKSWRKGKSEEEERDALVKEKGQLMADLSRMREELSQVREVDAADVTQLRNEMQRLADRMLSGAKPAKPTGQQHQTGPSATKKAPHTTDAKQDTDRAKKKDDPVPAKKASTRAGKTRESLSDRLSSLKRKNVKEDA
jgi:DNA repair exonuclease SbcCD ATPase subunit